MAMFIIVLIGLAMSSAAGSAVRNLASISSSRNWTESTVSHDRFKRQLQCGLEEFQCGDGTCIDFDGECDGKIDCPDKSDETHALCRNKICQNNLFRCTYGACVDGNAPCNNVIDCADQSDELLPQCHNETRQLKDKYRCLDDSEILVQLLCDGLVNCLDGSDETVQACGNIICPGNLFQCAYGACVDQGADCNGINDCLDGSDEAEELCNQIQPTVEVKRRPVASGQCKLPPYPEHGTYTTGSNTRQAVPGQVLPYVKLNISCDEGYGVDGDSEVFCQDGRFSRLIPQCVRFCTLDPHISVDYFCEITGKYKGHRFCKSAEPVGTVVQPRCKSPNYYSNLLYYMRCQDNGKWNRIVTCHPECGLVTPAGDGLIINGTMVNRGEVPWHVAIYRKQNYEDKSIFYEHICGGSIVSNSIVISAGHCFWDSDKPHPANMFSVATAKLFKQWDHPDDKDAQKSELKYIKLPEHFRGSLTNFQSDIAVLILEKPFKYYPYVRPVCLSLRSDYNDQPQNGELGKVAGYGLLGEDGTESVVLKVVDLPILSIDECYRSTPLAFREYITSDKICAGYNNGMAALCKGDSGGGLSFPKAEDHNITRFYLRGVASTAPTTNQPCNPSTVSTFTLIRHHEDFIKQFL